MRQRRGVALVTVLLVLAALAGIGASLSAARRTTTTLATNARAEVAARYAAESGIVAIRSEIQSALGNLADDTSRERYLNALSDQPREVTALGDARFQVAIVDPSTQLDINAASEGNLVALFSQLAPLANAREAATAIASYRQRHRVAGTPFTEPIRSLEELAGLPRVDRALLERAAPYLTVDGESSVNVSTASRIVRAAAFGDEHTAPTRLVFVARGWLEGHPLSLEIHAVYAISNSELVLLHWREQHR